MKYKAMLCTLLAFSLLSGCGSETEIPSSPAIQEEISSDQEEISSDQEEKSPNQKQESSDQGENQTIEMCVPGIFGRHIMEEIKQYNPVQRPEDACWVMTVPKGFPSDLAHQLIDDYNQKLSETNDYPVKSASYNDDFSKLILNVEHPEDSLVEIMRTSSMLYGACAINHSPTYRLQVVVKNNQDQSIYQTIDFPDNQAESVGAILEGGIEVYIADAYLEKDFEGNDCLTVYYLLCNRSAENISFLGDVADIAFQNGIQIDGTISSTENPQADPAKALQPGYSMVVSSSYVLSNTEDDVTIEVSRYMGSGHPKVSKTFVLSEFPDQYKK